MLNHEAREARGRQRIQPPVRPQIGDTEAFPEICLERGDGVGHQCRDATWSDRWIAVCRSMLPADRLH